VREKLGHIVKHVFMTLSIVIDALLVCALMQEIGWDWVEARCM
jgi:hypothetical protein